MSSDTTKADVLAACAELHSLLVEAELIESDVADDPWAAVDNVSAGPDLQYTVENLAPLTIADMAIVSNAYAQGRIDIDVMLKILDLLKIVLPVALSALAAA